MGTRSVTITTTCRPRLRRATAGLRLWRGSRLRRVRSGPGYGPEAAHRRVWWRRAGGTDTGRGRSAGGYGAPATAAMPRQPGATGAGACTGTDHDCRRAAHPSARAAHPAARVPQRGPSAMGRRDVRHVRDVGLTADAGDAGHAGDARHVGMSAGSTRWASRSTVRWVSEVTRPGRRHGPEIRDRRPGDRGGGRVSGRGISAPCQGATLRQGQRIT